MKKQARILTQKDKTIRLLISLAVGIIIAVLPPPVGIERVGMVYMGIFIATILMLCTKAVDELAGGLFAMIACCLFGVCSYGEAFKYLSSSSIGIAFAVLVLSAGVSNSGLMRRISLKMMTIVPNSYNGRIAGLMAGGLVMSPLISSTVAKAQLMTPVATTITELSGIPKKSKPALGILFATFMTTYITGYCFMSGTSNSPMLAGYASDAASDGIRTWLGWLSMTWPWLIILIVGTWVFSTIICKPKQGEVQDLPDDYFKKQYADLGPWTGKEKYALGVLVYTLGMWIAAQWTHMDSAVIALSAVVLLCFGGLMNNKDFASKTMWGLIFFMVMLFSIPGFLTSLGWAEVIKTIIGPIAAPLVKSVWIFVPCIMIIEILLRFLVASQLACLAILMAIFSPLLAESGMALIVMIWPLYMIGNYWLFPYQNGFIMAAHGAAGDEYVSQEAFCKTSWYYLAITFVAMICTIPVFQLLGLA